MSHFSLMSDTTLHIKHFRIAQVFSSWHTQKYPGPTEEQIMMKMKEITMMEMNDICDIYKHSCENL